MHPGDAPAVRGTRIAPRALASMAICALHCVNSTRAFVEIVRRQLPAQTGDAVLHARLHVVPGSFPASPPHGVGQIASRDRPDAKHALTFRSQRLPWSWCQAATASWVSIYASAC